MRIPDTKKDSIDILSIRLVCPVQTKFTILPAIKPAKSYHSNTIINKGNVFVYASYFFVWREHQVQKLLT